MSLTPARPRRCRRTGRALRRAAPDRHPPAAGQRLGCRQRQDPRSPQFAALATTSSGFANSLGRHDGGVTRDEALAHGAEPRRGDAAPCERRPRERLTPPTPDEVADTVASAAATGLAGCSIEDWDPRRAGDLRPCPGASTASPRPPTRPTPDRSGWSSPRGPRTTSAASTTSTTRSPDCRRSPQPVPTSCTRPGISTPEQIRCVVDAVDVPVNVLVRPRRAADRRAGRARCRPHLRRRRVRPRRLSVPSPPPPRTARARHVRVLGGRGDRRCRCGPPSIEPEARGRLDTVEDPVASAPDAGDAAIWTRPPGVGCSPPPCSVRGWRCSTPRSSTSPSAASARTSTPASASCSGSSTATR